MGRQFTKQESAFEIPDEDSYVLRFEGVIDTREFDNRDNPEGPKDVSMNCRFIVDEPGGEWDGTEIRAFYPEKVTDGNKTGKLFAAMFGGKLPDKFSEDDLMGRRFKATVSRNDRGYAVISSPIALRERQGRGSASQPSSLGGSESSVGVPGVDEPGF